MEAYKNFYRMIAVILAGVAITFIVKSINTPIGLTESHLQKYQFKLTSTEHNYSEDKQVTEITFNKDQTVSTEIDFVDGKKWKIINPNQIRIGEWDLRSGDHSENIYAGDVSIEIDNKSVSYTFRTRLKLEYDGRKDD